MGGVYLLKNNHIFTAPTTKLPSIMDELFFKDIKTPQAGKLHSSSIQALREVHFMGQPLLNSQIPDFSDTTQRTSVVPQIQAFGPCNNRQSLVLPSQDHEQVYRKPKSPSGRTPPITYSRTLYRKSDYSAYNKQIPQMPTLWRSEKAVSQSGLFITPPQSPAKFAPPPIPELESTSTSESEPEPVSELESTQIQRNFSRKFTTREVKQISGHLPVIQRTKTMQSEAADIESGSSTPISTISAHNDADRASLNTLADSLRRSLTPPSLLKEKRTDPER